MDSRIFSLVIWYSPIFYLNSYIRNNEATKGAVQLLWIEDINRNDQARLAWQAKAN